MPGQHALLSPSAAHRWLNCTAAPRLEQGEPESDSTFAQEGTLAHAYCARHLKEFLGIPVDAENAEIAQYNEQYHTGEMDEYTDTYKTIVLEKFNNARTKTHDAQLLVEVQLDFSQWVPEAFGTADAIIIADGVMEVIDFKYGKGVQVSATGNPQMMIYALGAYDRFSFEYNITHVRMTIVQPRIGNLSEYEVTIDELLAWGAETLQPKAKEAFSKDGKQQPGKWCQFCKVKAKCKALANAAMATVDVSPDPGLLTREQIETVVLPNLETIKTWVKGVEEYTLQQALSGVQYNGFKLVEGRSIRKVTDSEAVQQVLKEQGIDESLYLKPVELRTITDLEKNIGKKQFAALCGQYIEKPQGKPTLVPESDKRQAIDPLAEDFKNVDVQ